MSKDNAGICLGERIIPVSATHEPLKSTLFANILIERTIRAYRHRSLLFARGEGNIIDGGLGKTSTLAPPAQRLLGSFADGTSSISESFHRGLSKAFIELFRKIDL